MTHYHISRSGQTYGPYTLEDLQRYLASGNVLATDLARSDETTEWLPVSQILAAASVQGVNPLGSPPPADPYQQHGAGYHAPIGQGYPGPPYAAPAAYGQPLPGALAASQYPDAPNLHWGLYLLFAILTCGFFSKIFTIVQAAWLKRVQPNSAAIFFYVATYVLWLFNTYRSRYVFSAFSTYHFDAHAVPFAPSLGLLYWAALIAIRFVMRNSLQEHFNTAEPVGLRLSGVMTFFFGGVYFQYHLNRINAVKQAARFGMGRSF